VTSSLEPSGKPLTRVSYSGVGIVGQELSAVFGQFVRARTDYVAKQEGTGLELAICKTFVELEGGGIDIDSTLGQGTTGSIMLPAERIVGATVIGHQHDQSNDTASAVG